MRLNLGKVQGTGIHDSVLLDLRQAGRLDIVGKPLRGYHKRHIFAWFNHPEAMIFS